jgi:hypothetical protein
MCAQNMMDRQRRLYNEISQEAETWKVRHDEAMLCRDIEDAIGIGLSILESIRRRGEHWAREIEDGGAQFSWDQSRELAEQYRWWLEPSTVLLEAIDACERENYQIQNARRFRDAYQDVSLMSLDVDRDRQSLASLATGSGIPAKEAMDALRRGVRPGSA